MSNENNSSAPLKTALPTDVEAFEHFVSDCDGAGIQYDGPSYEQGFLSGKVVGMDAAQAVAAQAAPAAVAVPEWDKVRRGLAMVMLGFAGRSDCTESAAEAALDAVTEAGMPLEGLRAALAATPVLPATEDSSAGDLGEVQNETTPLTCDLIESVDAWFAQNTGLGGCSDKDVAELAAIFAAPQANLADVQDAKHWRDHIGKLDALVTYCPTCCQGFTAKPEMTRDEVIFECGKTAARSEAKAKEGN